MPLSYRAAREKTVVHPKATAGYNPGMPTAPPRRWFAFRLRTVFVVVAVVALLALSVRRETLIVEERRALREWVERNGRYGGWIGYAYAANGARPRPRIPRFREFLEDEAVEHVGLPRHSTDADLELAKSLFPEASDIGRDMP
jgi:hypothetical protein